MLLDACVLSELARPAPGPHVLAGVDSVRDDALRLSVLTLGEIRKGADLLEDGPRKLPVEAWLDERRATFADRILPVDEAVALHGGRIGAASRRAGRVDAPLDSLLAAPAVCPQLELATRTLADFEGTGAVLVHPWEPASCGFGACADGTRAPPPAPDTAPTTPRHGGGAW